MKLLLLLGSGILLALGITGSSAFAAKPGAGTCSGGAPGFGNAEVIPAGTYAGFTVTGYCVFGPGTMTINGKLTIADGAQLNDHASGWQSRCTSLGTSRSATAPFSDWATTTRAPHNSAIVDGNVTAHQPETLYLGGMTVHGNVVSNGGGNPASERNFPFKDNTVDGNVIIQGGTDSGSGSSASTWRKRDRGQDLWNAGGPPGYRLRGNPRLHRGRLQRDRRQPHLPREHTPGADRRRDPRSGQRLNTVGGNAIGECADLAG